MKVMDVGTGRQALAFHQLGALKIDHYDQSAEFVSGLKAFIDHEGIEGRMSTRRADLVEYRLPENTYDFILLTRYCSALRAYGARVEKFAFAPWETGGTCGFTFTVQALSLCFITS